MIAKSVFILLKHAIDEMLFLEEEFLLTERKRCWQNSIKFFRHVNLANRVEIAKDLIRMKLR